ncbi:hypothetical protein MUY27_04300 [Mucilaginibacter sp. RS28]|uniref:Uncharacterized protein n=1 Tax=Mucilaginibacter straminoryzae TaxID=2932774 RepID=A0A9X1X0D2_9SPHI|nr:hypothetical protein [Mucilaginibacter straminoryzae]MCJ8208917.1 hypothetical protein [Mucilaginibacter straminoryzae]
MIDLLSTNNIFMAMTLEITDQEYLIKLDRKKFGLAFIRSLLKQVEVENLTEDDLYLSETRPSIKDKDTNASEPDYFGSIDEK